jgi:hypothetical protein
MTKRLVYGHAQLHDCLAFADADTAVEEANEIVSIATAPTYGAAAAIRTRYIDNPAAEMVEEDAVAADEPVDIFNCWGVSDGDWPPMVTSRALHLLPDDVRSAFGLVVVTNFNGDYLDIPVDAEQETVAALRRDGYTVTRDDNLINVLDGRTFNPAGDEPVVWPAPTALA